MTYGGSCQQQRQPQPQLQTHAKVTSLMTTSLPTRCTTAAAASCGAAAPWAPLAGVMQRLIEKHYSCSAGHRYGRVSRARDSIALPRICFFFFLLDFTPCLARCAVCVRAKHAIGKFIKNHFH